MTWKELQQRLAQDKGQWSRISRETGLHINAVRKIAIGEVAAPRISTIEKLAGYYAKHGADPIDLEAA